MSIPYLSLWSARNWKSIRSFRNRPISASPRSWHRIAASRLGARRRVDLGLRTGARAAVVTANRRDLAGQVVVVVDGGELLIDWRETDPANRAVFMTGPAATSFSGTIDESLLDERDRHPDIRLPAQCL